MVAQTKRSTRQQPFLPMSDACCNSNNNTTPKSAMPAAPAETPVLGAAISCGCAPAPHQHADGAAHGHADDGHDHGPLPGAKRLAASLAIAIGAELMHFLAPDTGAWRIAGMALAALAIALAGVGIYKSGLRSLLRGKLGIDALMTVAVTGAFLIGQWPEAAMVMALYALAELIEHRAADRARHAISSLMALAPDEAEVLGDDGAWRRMPAREVALGASVRVRPGERLPFDGVIERGNSAID